MDLHSLWNSPGQNTGTGSLSLLQGIFPTQGLNPGFPHCRRILYQLSHKGSPRILAWVVYAFFRGSYRPKNCSTPGLPVYHQSHVQLFATPWIQESSWNSPDQNTGVGSLFLLQGISPIQRLNPGLLHCRQILYQLSHKGSPRILEWVAYPFSSGSSRPRNQMGVSCIAGGFFTS